MSVIFNQAQWAAKAIESYRHPEPFSIHLKRFYREHKFMGSKDRRVIRDMAYCYFRFGRTIKAESMAEAILISLFVLTDNKMAFRAIDSEVEIPVDPQAWFHQFYPKWVYDDLVNFKNHISEAIGLKSYFKYILTQPGLFVTSSENILRQLKLSVSESKEITDFPNAVELPNGFNLDTLPNELKQKLQVQDLSSQWACSKIELKPAQLVWDCCSGSGGKTLSLFRQQPAADFYVSDFRENSIQNLKLRFSETGIQKYHTALIDHTKVNSKLKFFDLKNNTTEIKHDFFDIIIVDAPCSGSGTWGRNPEHLPFFKPESLKNYSKRQLEICQNVLPFLKTGGMLYYITCSVFADENENMVPKIEQLGIKPKWQQYFDGFNHHSDNIFISCFCKT